MKSVQALTSELIDYAGLFPPAELSMRRAVESYADYVAGPDSSSLGRFILPSSRMEEFETEAKIFLPRSKNVAPWRISALVSGDVTGTAQRLLKFNCEHWTGSELGHAVVDAIEMKIGQPDEIRAESAGIPPSFVGYFEVPLDDNLDRAIAEVRRAGARAKVRTGGVTANAFLSAAQVLRFLRTSFAAGVSFKATAGLHHPVRSAYPFTYEPDSERGMMFGFLNVFLAAALLRGGADDESVLALLGETDGASFHFSDAGLNWRERFISTAEITETRRSFAISFGSCSFREPVDELKQLTAGVALA
jgi:hypothetical protein